MPRVISLADFVPPPAGVSLALGFFDGFHRGHQAILAEAARSGEAHVFTFRNHPATVIDSHNAPALLTSFEERVQLLASAGATVVYTEFDRPFSELDPEAFVTTYLKQSLAAHRVVVGHNYRFGFRASGTVKLLHELGTRHGFQTTVVDPVIDGEEWISSTRVRRLVGQGEVARACQLLGRPYFLTSVVERGNQRGRTLGTPTANLLLPPHRVAPARGVYAVKVRFQGADHPGVANLGVRPTFGEDRVILEVHLLDHRAELYGERLEVNFIRRLRAERKFPSREALMEQIAQDVEQARNALS